MSEYVSISKYMETHFIDWDKCYTIQQIDDLIEQNKFRERFTAFDVENYRRGLIKDLSWRLQTIAEIGLDELYVFVDSSCEELYKLAKYAIEHYDPNSDFAKCTQHPFDRKNTYEILYGDGIVEIIDEIQTARTVFGLNVTDLKCEINGVEYRYTFCINGWRGELEVFFTNPKRVIGSVYFKGETLVAGPNLTFNDIMEEIANSNSFYTKKEKEDETVN